MIAIAPTRQGWVDAAIAALPVLLVDHAHCERKAAQMALKLMARHADRPAVQLALSRLAREELVHFERVLRELDQRGIPFGPQSSGGYAAALFAEVTEPGDELLCAALIEARSHERFVRLAAAVDDPGLCALYGDLLEAEERHGELYLALYRELHGHDGAARLSTFALREDQIVHRARQPVRMHAGGL